MLSNPPQPISVASGQMRIGEILVDAVSREVNSPHAHRPLRVTPKAMAVLCVLAEASGQVVGRDVLLARVWPDTLPTDDVLTQAVTQLRKAFGAQGKDYIETIAKAGYRLVAPVQHVGPGAGAEPERAGGGALQVEPAAPGVLPSMQQDLRRAQPGPGPITAPRRRPGRVLVAVLAALALGTVAWLSGHDEPAQPAHALPADVLERPYRVITTAPGFELAPTLSPDASMVAYSSLRSGASRAAIFVQPTTPAQPRQLSTPPDGASDSLPAWSPDGREIAFARRWADGSCRVMLAPASGGAEREITRCDGTGLLSFRWSPDQSGLLFGSMGAGGEVTGIRLFDLASGQWQAIAYDPSAGLDHAPGYSPDGRWIAFVRNPQLGDLWRMPAEGGEAEQLTWMGAEIRGWSWLSDSRSLVFSSRVDVSTRLYRLDIDSGTVTDLGISDAQAPTVATGSDALAFVRRQPRFGIHRVVREAGGASPQVERIFTSPGRDVLPSVSPDGTQIVFGSDRTGHFELWWADLDDPDSLRPVEGLHPDTRHLPVWASDSQRVLVPGWREPDTPGIFEVEPASGQSTALPVPGGRPLSALYLPDPSHLLVTEKTSQGGARLVLYERSHEPWRRLREVVDVSQARVDADRGRILFTRLSGDGLWQADLQLSPHSIEQVAPRAPQRWRHRTWAVADDGGIEYLDRARGCQARLTRIGGTIPDTPRCLDPERPGSTNGFSIDPRSGDLYVALAVEDGTDVAFLDAKERIARPQARFSRLLNLLRNNDS